MPLFHNDILHSITKYLKPKDLFSFILTHKGAEYAVTSNQRDEMKLWGPILKEYDKVFKEYAWVDRVTSLGLTPILIYRDEKKAYVDLWLAQNEQPWGPDGCKSLAFGQDRFSTDEERQSERRLIFNMILQSLRISEPGERDYLRKFSSFTLDLSGVLSCPVGIPIWDFRSLYVRRSDKFDVVIWGKGHRKLEQTLASEMVILGLAEFEDIHYPMIGGQMMREGETSWHYDFEFPPPTKGWKRCIRSDGNKSEFWRYSN
jgi:hypothetical protein